MSVMLDEQIVEVDREIAMRMSVYPNRVARQMMDQREADDRIAGMEAVKATLVWLKDNRKAVIAAVKDAPLDMRQGEML